MSDPREDVDNLIVRTREAHETLQELKRVQKEVEASIKVAEAVKVQMMAATAAVVNDAIEESISIGLESYMGAIQKAIDDATDAVYERFDLITEAILGEKGQDLIAAHAKARKTLTAEEVGGRLNDMYDTLKRKGVVGDL